MNLWVALAEMFVCLVLLAGGNCPSVLPARLLTALCYLETTRQQAENRTIDRQQTDNRHTY